MFLCQLQIIVVGLQQFALPFQVRPPWKRCSSGPLRSHPLSHFLRHRFRQGPLSLTFHYSNQLINLFLFSCDFGRLRNKDDLLCEFGGIFLTFQEKSIELVIIGEDGIAQSVCEQPVFGTIKDIAVLPWNDRFSTRNPQVCALQECFSLLFQELTTLHSMRKICPLVVDARKRSLGGCF